MDTHMHPVPGAEPGIGAVASANTSESPAINELATALARAQGTFTNPAKDRENPYFGSRYTTLGAVIEATRGPLADNGLSLTQTIGAGGGNGRAPILRTRLLHSSGQWLASEVPLFAAGKGSQAFGSELTYMRRYAVCALLNIAPAEGDDDGNAAQAATGSAGVSQAPRGEQRPRNGGGETASRAAGGPPTRAPSRAQAPRSGPAGDDRQDRPAREQPAIPGQPADTSRSAAPSQDATGTTTLRRKDEPSPPSVWGILRPGKAAITAPDGMAWLKWWTTIAGKAAAEGKHDELQALYGANVVAWDAIALGSAEAHDVVAEAVQAVRAVLDD